MFKIKNSEGLFSTGGQWPTFTASGKIFAKRGHVTSHLSQMTDKEKARFYTGCTVVEFEMVETGEVFDALDWRPLDSTIRAKQLEEERRKEREIEDLDSRRAKLEQELADIKRKTGVA
jgi:hypothetical protein